ncbi:hypothetical protein GT972_07320 [Sinimarinibacterium sp. NLF-5-8]|nr:hypothetical protein GT972_07320 [Sinimarinibacterium sp. NLF-5-8]
MLWLLLGYGFLTRVITAVQKPAVVEVLHGGWLLLVVATQGLAIMLLRVSARADVVFLSLCLFLIGSALYGILITLLMQRLLIERLRVQQFTSPYWINMGALAITTLAGGLLAAMLERQPDLVGVLPFVRGWTVLLWALGSWWVPLLVLLGVWKYVVGRQPIGYHVDHWSVVFPLGMYSVCTFTLAEAILPLPLLEALARWVARLALLAWLLVSVQALLLGCARAFRRSSVT